MRSAMLVLPLPAAVEEHAAAGVDGRAKGREQLGVEQKVVEGVAQAAFVGLLQGDGLLFDRLAIDGQRHWRGADVHALIHVPAGPVAAGVGEVVGEIAHVGAPT